MAKPMTTRQRIALLAPVVAGFPELAGWGDADALLQVVKKELGAEDALELGAVAPPRLLHIISANTAMAGMQSLVRGIILGSENWLKLPGAGLPRLEEMVDKLPPALRTNVHLSRQLESGWLENADAVIVFGSDATVETFRKQVDPSRIFAGYGHRWSGAVVFADPDFSSVEKLLEDIVLYDQMGCLSAQIIWIGAEVNAIRYGQYLAEALERYIGKNKPVPLASDERSSVASWRLAREWDIATQGGRAWFSAGEPVWGVVVGDTASAPILSCLHRHVLLLPFSKLPNLGNLAGSVSTLGVWPDNANCREQLATLGASRICPVGEMQFPGPDWHQDGVPALARLVKF